MEDIIHAMAGSPSAFRGTSTPGMLTPKELTMHAGSEASGGLSSAGHGGREGGGYNEEPNPFNQFSSVTRDVEGW